MAAGTVLWASPVPGSYDIVVDVNQNGTFETPIDYIDDTPEVGAISVAVTLSSFTARVSPTGSGVLLRWRTATETNNLGFNLYRSEKRDGAFEKINTVLIKGAGTDATPHDYQFVDEGIQPGKVYYYYIEDTDFSGVTNTSHLIKVGAPTSKAKFTTLWGAMKKL